MRKLAVTAVTAVAAIGWGIGSAEAFAAADFKPCAKQAALFEQYDIQMDMHIGPYDTVCRITG